MTVDKRSGTQSIGRAMALLREVAARGHFGWQLGDLALRCGLDKGTTHRLLAHLKRERMVAQRAADRRYLPGPLMFELGLALREHGAFIDACEVPLDRLARRLNAVALLCLRSGADFVCAGRAGALPEQSLSLQVGTRRPLLASSAGVAILLALPKEEAREILEQNRQMLRRGGVPLAALDRMWRQSQARGLGANEQDMVPGWNAYAVAIRDARSVPFASLMAAAPSDAFALAARPEIVEALEQTAAKLGRECARLLPDGY
jgi:DNA-binding IclR family transcriptional regulator